MQETIRFLRHIWDDTGWRTAIIASFLTFLLETFMVVGDAPVGTSLMWDRDARLADPDLPRAHATAAARPAERRGEHQSAARHRRIGHCPGDLHLHQRRSDLHRSADLLAVLARLRLDPSLLAAHRAASPPTAQHLVARPHVPLLLDDRRDLDGGGRVPRAALHLERRADRLCLYRTLDRGPWPRRTDHESTQRRHRTLRPCSPSG